MRSGAVGNGVPRLHFNSNPFGGDSVNEKNGGSSPSPPQRRERWATAFSRPSRFSWNMGKIRAMVPMVSL